GDGDGTTGAWGGETAPLFTTGTFISPAARVSGTMGIMDGSIAIPRRVITTAPLKCAAAEIQRSIGTTTLTGTITGTITGRTTISGSHPLTTVPTTQTGPTTMSGQIIT